MRAKVCKILRWEAVKFVTRKILWLLTGEIVHFQV